MARSEKRWDEGVPWGFLVAMASASYVTFWGWREWHR
jgi:hypothetical protein